MVAQFDEDGEKAFTCVEVEATRSRSNSKKSGTEGSTNSDRAVYSAVCRAQSNDGQTYVGVGKLNGRPVKVLRDTGCTGMFVDRALVPEVMVMPGSSGSLQMVDHTLISVPLVNVYLDSPYYKGHCRVMCVSSPVYPVIIGNVRGARRMLPDPDWKAEDQPGVGARTSWGKKDKDNDDNQGGDIPAWMFRRSNQKTEKKTEVKILPHFFWPGLRQDVIRFCRSCDMCQRTVKRGSVKKVPLGSMPLIDTPFKRVVVDTVGPIAPPSEAGHRYILTLVDYATRYPEAVPLKKITTEVVAE